jgi:hypothetical protein
MQTTILVLLLVQAVLGGLDTILNHELIEHLPERPEARREIGLHALRETNYAVLFAGLGWAEWHGAAALVIALLLVAEIGITAVDEAVENRTRVLPQNERVMHVFLTLNLAAIITLLAPVLTGWWQEPSGLVAVNHGLFSWVLLAFSAAGIAWALRDFIAWRRHLVHSRSKGGRDALPREPRPSDRRHRAARDGGPAGARAAIAGDLKKR